MSNQDAWWNATRIDSELKARAKEVMKYFNMKDSDFTRDSVELYTSLLEEKLAEHKKLNR